MPSYFRHAMSQEVGYQASGIGGNVGRWRAGAVSGFFAASMHLSPSAVVDAIRLLESSGGGDIVKVANGQLVS